MKRFMLAIALLMTAGTAVMATEKENLKVSFEAQKAFEKQFPGAHFASWEQISDANVYIVRFGYNNKSLAAYIDREGAVLATVRNLQPENLPFSVAERLSTSYSNYQIRLIEELTVDLETSYVLLVENEKAKITLRIYSNGEYYELKKIKKKSLKGNLAKK